MNEELRMQNEELQAQAGARVGQAPLQMDVAALRLRQGCGATGRGRAHSAKGRFRGVSILVEAISCVCETTMNGRMTHGGDRVQRNPIESKLIRPWGLKK